MVWEADGFPALRTLFPLSLGVGVCEPGGYVDDFAERISVLTNAFGNFFSCTETRKQTCLSSWS